MVAEFDSQTFRILYALFQVVILAMVLERGLYFVFDYRHLRDRLPGWGLKAPITLGVAWSICWQHNFDVIARIVDPGGETAIGVFITATIVSGGSAAAMRLFHDVLKLTRAARQQMSPPKPRKNKP